MRRIAWVMGLWFGLATGAFGQVRGFGRGGFVVGGGFHQPSFGNRFNFGFGSVVFPGGRPTLHQPLVRPFFGRRAFYSPFAYPLFGGGFGYYGDFGYQYPPSPPTVIVVYPPPPAPQVIVEERESPRTVRSEIRDYTDQSVVFLIALKDQSIVSALAYWVVDDTLNYIDTNGQKQQTPLWQVDRALSERLNRAKKIDFGLPPE
jgi:hypothetical protein